MNISLNSTRKKGKKNVRRREVEIGILGAAGKIEVGTMAVVI